MARDNFFIKIIGSYPLVVFVAFLAVTKFIAFLFTDPIISGDTPMYLDLAKRIRHLDFIGYDGYKPPGYPLIILSAFLKPKIVVLYQLIMGMFIIIFIIKIIRSFTQNLFLPYIAASVYAFFIPFPYYELFILSETVATFFITFAFYILIACVFDTTERTKANFLIIGLAAAFAALTRAIYLILPFLYALFFLWVKRSQTPPKTIVKNIVLILLPGLVLCNAWSLVNYTYNGTYFLATGRSYGLMELLIDHIDEAPDHGSFPLVKEAYQKHKKILIDRGDPYHDAIWGAAKSLEAAGMTQQEIATTVRAMCWEIIRKNPMAYAKAVFNSWINFWLPEEVGFRHLEEKNYFKFLTKQQNRFIITLLKSINTVQKYILIMIEILFLLAPLFLLKKSVSQKMDKIRFLPIFLLTYTLVVSISLIIAFIEGGEGRFAIPTFPLLLCMTLIFYERLCISEKKQLPAAHQHA